MKNKRLFRWIQISDLHIGKENNVWEDNIIRERMLKCIDDNMKPIDFMVITGDIFHKGKIDRKNCELAKKLLLSLKQITPKIIFCIGNHDFERTTKRTDYLMLLNQEQDKNERGNIYSEDLKNDFEKFVSFCKDIELDENPVEIGTYIYHAVEELNIVVLNTSIFAGNPKYDKNGKCIKNRVDDDGRLWFADIDMPDIGKINMDNPTIILGHHTIQMFDEKAQLKIIKMFKELHAAGYFCGHMHRTVNRKINGIKQYTIAGTFLDDYNVPTMSLFTLENGENISQKNFIYKDYEWVENHSKLEKIQQIPAIIKKSVEKFKRILKYENIVEQFDETATEVSILEDTKESCATKEEFEKQNIRKILGYCYCLLNDCLTYENDYNDKDISWAWVNMFFDHIKYVNDRDLQFLWGKILAGEIVNQGTISKRTMTLVENLSREEAIIFNDFLKYILNSPDESRNGVDSDYYIICSLKECGHFTYYDILSLADAVLLMETPATVTVTVKPGEQGYIRQNKKIVITFENVTDEVKIYEARVWLLTVSGRELYKLLAGNIYNNDDFYKKCKEEFEEDSVLIANIFENT